MVREAAAEDLDALLQLYLYLHEDSVPAHDDHLYETWDHMIQDQNYHVIVYESDGRIVSSCVCIIIPNLTHEVRPFALVEYVVTHEAYRGKGYASQCLHYAKEIAVRENCYKIMLMTGSKKPETLNFYRNAGYSSEDKTAFTQWL
ncbi:MAG: GNAT family N-acetyltransferase [Lachnospiraceae bacterium]|nr:GNAT family N-acetyltransferase [Lachnospiraceae bacterium]